MSATNAWLTVSRNRSDDVGHRQVALSLDSVAWTALVFGQSSTREIAPGPHRLTADNTLLRKSVAFEAMPGQHVQFTVANRKGFGTWFLMLLGSPLLYVALFRAEDRVPGEPG